MLSLNPGCLCDVCAEEYSAHSLPHSIPCGHVLCSNCCNSIIAKTSTRLTPSCPFCREHFTSDSIRLIRIDFGGSGYSTPRRVTVEAPDIVTDIFSRKDDSPKVAEHQPRVREDARRLEQKVARIAAQKSSVEEVSLLHQELQSWLCADASESQSSALQLSAALLRAILVNHVSHSEATKAAKNSVDELEASNARLESELRSLRTQYNQKAQECQNLKAELGRAKPSRPTSPPPAMSASSSLVSTTFRPRSAMAFSTPPVPPATPSPGYHTPTHHSPLARSTPSSRSSSISAPRLSKTPSPPSTRPNSPPALSHRPRMASPSPQKMVRSLSADEKEKDRVHQRWLPLADPEFLGNYTSRSQTPFTSTSRFSAAQSGIQPPRFGTPVSR